MDGGAERYLGHGFLNLAHARYQLGDDLLASVTLDVYDMGGELGAFGIYRSVRPSDAEPRPWCAEAFLAGTVASAWKGEIYIHCAADDDRPELIATAERLVEHVCDAIPGDATLPAILNALPQQDLVPFSERHVASDLLGHAFLPGGVTASYEIDGGKAELFFSDLGTEAAAADALAALREHYSKWGEITGGISDIGDDGFIATDPSLGTVYITRVDRFVAGTYGKPPMERQLLLLMRLLEGLRAHTS
jgi:hypothetical protein